MIPLYPFHVAAENVPGWASGEVVRYGAILKSRETGRIVAHLQETSVLSRALHLGAATIPTSPGPVTSLVGVTQNEQIKSRLRQMESVLGGVQTLQIATLATSLLGITMASTALVLHRLKSIGSAIERTEARIGALPAAVDELCLHETITDLHTDLERLEERSGWRDATPVLRDLENRLDRAFARFVERARRVATRPQGLDADLLATLLASIGLCAGVQLRAIPWLDELQVAAPWSASTLMTLRKTSQFPRRSPPERRWAPWSRRKR